MIKPGVAEKIERFVADGGTFVTGYFSGVVNENDLCFLGGTPCGKLKKVFDIWAEEVDTLWPDIRKKIKLFEGKNIVLDSEEMENIVLSKSFNIVLDYDNKQIKDFSEIVKFLFEIGFIGLLIDTKYKKTYNMITQQGFIFNEGIACLRGFLNNDFDDCKFLINPIFTETLHLNINTEEYIGVSNWADLEEYDSIVQLRMRSDCLGDVD